MFLKCSKRKKNGKEHRSWSIVESRRLSDGRSVQAHVLYLGEINDSQQAAWRKTIEVFDAGEKPGSAGAPRAHQMAIFPDDRPPPAPPAAAAVVDREEIVSVRLHELELHHPRQWGACWLALWLWRQLELDRFWAEKLPPGREKTPWDLVLTTLVVYRLIDPGSEWRLHREWFKRSAMGDLLGQDFRIAQDDTLYRCLDRLLAHKEALFLFLKDRWRDLFNARYEVLLYDLTSTYFECDVPRDPKSLRRFGYSRDKRGDCVQVVIALILTPEGFPLGYEVMAGNTIDNQTLGSMLAKIEARHGKAERTWLMDRGIPTEAVLENMRKSDPPVRYLVGTPKGRLAQFEARLAESPWAIAREGVSVKAIEEEGELYLLAKSRARGGKERGMRQRRLKKYWKRLQELQKQKLTYESFHQKYGAAKKEAGAAAKLVEVQLPERPAAQSKSSKAQTKKRASTEVIAFGFSLLKPEVRKARSREGSYLLRSNLAERDPAKLWQHYMTLGRIEEAFRNLKGDLALRPIYHSKENRIEAHIFVAFLAYCLHVTFQQRLKGLAPGLSPRSVLEKFASLQMIDVHLPTTDGRRLILSRYTQPDTDCRMLLDQLKLSLPEQAPPKIAAQTTPAAPK